LQRSKSLLAARFDLNQEAELQQLLKEAGFRQVTTRAEMRELSLPAAGEFLWQYIGSTPLASVVAAADGEARSALEREVVAEWQAFGRGDGMSYRQRIVVATARR
jgi:hypothetical protein